MTFVFYGEELLAHRPTPKLEYHPSSAVRHCLFNIFAVALHIGGRSSIRNLRTRHAVVTGTHKTWLLECYAAYMGSYGRFGTTYLVPSSRFKQYGL
jgi:hypothetical protein